MKDINSKMRSVLEGKKKENEKVVIYGVYDNSNESLFVRLNDFLIDHSHISLQEKTYFFHLLAVMIDAGIPLIKSLKMLARRTKSERFRRILNTVAYNVMKGSKLSDALARFPDVFGSMEIGVIKSGEAVGNLDRMLFKLSVQLEKLNNIQMKIITASVYPLVVLVLLVVVAIGMLGWVIPGLVGMLEDAGMSRDDFPFATKLLLGISDFLGAYWWVLIFLGIILFILFKIYVATENGKFNFDLFKLKFPVVGNLIKKVQVLRFVSMLGILVDSGLPVVESLQIIARSLQNEIYKLKVWEIISKVKNGGKISEGISDAPFLFSGTVVEMISVAEQSASIGPMSEKIGKQYDTEIDNSLKRLMSMFTPLMIVIVGIFVALLALAILMPMFKLNELVA